MKNFFYFSVCTIIFLSITASTIENLVVGSVITCSALVLKHELYKLDINKKTVNKTMNDLCDKITQDTDDTNIEKFIDFTKKYYNYTGNLPPSFFKRNHISHFGLEKIKSIPDLQDLMSHYYKNGNDRENPSYWAKKIRLDFQFFNSSSHIKEHNKIMMIGAELAVFGLIYVYLKIYRSDFNLKKH